MSDTIDMPVGIEVYNGVDTLFWVDINSMVMFGELGPSFPVPLHQVFTLAPRILLTAPLLEYKARLALLNTNLRRDKGWTLNDVITVALSDDVRGQQDVPTETNEATGPVSTDEGAVLLLIKALQHIRSRSGADSANWAKQALDAYFDAVKAELAGQPNITYDPDTVMDAIGNPAGREPNLTFDITENHIGPNHGHLHGFKTKDELADDDEADPTRPGHSVHGGDGA